MELKLVFSIISIAVSFLSYAFYLADIFKGRTKPHMITYFIWLLSVGVAFWGMIEGDGGHGITILIFSALFLICTFVLSFFKGTKDIVAFDWYMLLLATIGIVFSLIFKDPLIALVCVVVADGIGYIPTFRKTFRDPHSESLTSWVLSVVSPFFFLLALAQINIYTALYPAAFTVLNIGMVFIICRRYKIPKSS